MEENFPLRFRYDDEMPQGHTRVEHGDGFEILVLGTKKPEPDVSYRARILRWIEGLKR
jgi:hypothetical protein